MGLIVKNVEIMGDKGNKEVRMLFDNGAGSSLIRKDVAMEIATLSKALVPRHFQLGDGKTTITSDELAIVFFKADGKVIDYYFYVLDDLAKEVIVGADCMQKWDIVLYPKEERVEVKRDPDAIEFFSF